MASSTKTLQTLILVIFFLSSLFSLSVIKSSSSTEAAARGEIAVYWGQNIQDDTLNSTCDSRLYSTVVLAFLNVFGCGRTPQLNFVNNHCVGGGNDCTALHADIKRCQTNGVKVLLSLGGPSGSYAICSPRDAKDAADKLYNNFLSNRAGPLGTVILDGIDFRIENTSTSDKYYWDNLAKALDEKRYGRISPIFYLSASPHCVIPDPYLDAAINTGVFDQLFVQFYNNSQCHYSKDNPVLLQNSWWNWTLRVKSSTSVFLGLPAAPAAAPGGGYVSPEQLNTTVLSLYAKRTSNYGGVAVWDRGYDVNVGYSANIKQYVMPPLTPPPPLPTPSTPPTPTPAVCGFFVWKNIIDYYI